MTSVYGRAYKVSKAVSEMTEIIRCLDSLTGGGDMVISIDRRQVVAANPKEDQMLHTEIKLFAIGLLARRRDELEKFLEAELK